MDDIAFARAIHVISVVIWIGGVAMVTTVVLPAVRRLDTAAKRVALFEAIEGRFVWQARIATLLVAASGFYMADRLELWARFRSVQFWWMHAMVLVWLVFTIILFIGEPLVMRARKRRGMMSAPDVNAPRMQRLHWVLLVLSVITVMAAVAGSHGMQLAP
jgi:uncharacterized membrane protein